MTIELLLAMIAPIGLIIGAWIQLSSRITRVEASSGTRAQYVDRELRSLHDEDAAIERRANDGLKQVLDHLVRIEERLQTALEGRHPPRTPRA